MAAESPREILTALQLWDVVLCKTYFLKKYQHPVKLCVPGQGRYVPPQPPWLSNRTQSQREAQPGPPAGTADPLC